MTDMKQVKVDNWGIYFLQRLKHFFNRTDYCDLTLQFQNNAQLKVHRLVLNTCTEYFELLERTCEMYDDCLIMPEDLQADVVVPIVNFMYTGLLEFKPDLLDKLLQTSQIMNMTVLSKLLDAQKNQTRQSPKQQAFPNQPKQSYSFSRTNNKRNYSKAFETPTKQLSELKSFNTNKKSSNTNCTCTKHCACNCNPDNFLPSSSKHNFPVTLVQRKVNPKKEELSEPRPTRYEVPEELEVCDDSFTPLSYESRPLMIHPETSKRYSKKSQYGIFTEASSSRKFLSQSPALEIVECRKVTTDREDSLFGDSMSGLDPEYPEPFDSTMESMDNNKLKDSNQLFNQVMESSGPKVTIEAKDAKQASNVDHTKIISEVLKKFPHLVNSNKNIKLKILEPNKTDKKPLVKKRELSIKQEPENIYEDVIDSKAAARLIALGAKNIKGPWICLICGTPGKALHLPSYYKFRRHLVEVHNEKPIPNSCEYCGFFSGKRNYLLYHLYTKHNIPPPSSYNFPKCNQCNYVALTKGYLIKHKASHAETRTFRCYVCSTTFASSSLLLNHIQISGHKVTGDRKPDLQCIYCLKVFLRETNLYAHLKTCHKYEAKRDGIVEDSEEEEETLPKIESNVSPVKFEYQAPYEEEDESCEMEYQIQSRPDGNIQVTASNVTPVAKQKILNTSFNQAKSIQSNTIINKLSNHEVFELNDQILSPSNSNIGEEMIISEQEYIEQDQTQLKGDGLCIPDIVQTGTTQLTESNTIEFISTQHEPTTTITKSNKTMKKELEENQHIEIMMSNDPQLMTPTHPVIFDSDGNPSKTLAVLTTLDDTHSGEMMLIPDNYNLNVSHSVDPKNSNIVVVYSHTMSDQSKQQYIVNPQYASSQIISSPQFVQTSAVITQDYASVPASIISVAQQNVETYQENIEQTMDSNQGNLITNDLQENHGQNVTEPEVVNNPEEPEQTSNVEMLEIEVCKDTSQTEGLEENVTNAEISHVQERSDINLQSQHNAPDMDQSMEVDIQPDSNMVVMSCEDIQQCEIVCEPYNNSNGAPELITENSLEVEEHNQSVITDEKSDDIPEELIQSNMTENNDNCYTKTTSNDEGLPDINMVQSEPEMLDNSHLITQDDIDENTKDGDVVITKIPDEQIQNLASEWSEDEEPPLEKETEANICEPITNDAICDENMKKSGICETNIHEQIVTEDNNPVIDKTPSTVNIQEDLTKQTDNEEHENNHNETLKLMSKTADIASATIIRPDISAAAPQAKISSLLNDWEENDSQDEQENNGTEIQEQVATNEIIPEIENTPNQLDEPVKPANISHLVSDWDEEE